MVGSVKSIQSKIKNNLLDSLERAKDAGKLSYEEVPDFVIEVPREKNHGDFASNLAMLLARQAKKAPREIAVILEQEIQKDNWLEKIEIAGPGFINFFLNNEWLYDALKDVQEQGKDYGRCDIGKREKVQVEFVSANPTGLLHMGNARGAALGDSIASLLDAAGYDVSREYYINDSGNQIYNFGRSLEARYLQTLGKNVPFPDEGYHGSDLIETVNRFVKKYDKKYIDTSEKVRQEALIQFALDEKINNIKEVLKEFKVNYDVWFSEQSLHDNGEVEAVVSSLKEAGYVYESEGAIWFKSSEFGYEKDEVLVRSNGTPTYFAADIAYHANKFTRGFKRVINIWGADHYGHVARMKGAVKAVGYDSDNLDIVIMQLVRLFQGGEILRMSKRTGTYITLQELLEEVGVDAARFFFIMRSADSHLDFDLDLAKSESQDNPVYYVQYAYARIRSILRQAVELDIDIPFYKEVNLKLLKTESELELIRKLVDLPVVIEGAAQALEPHRLTTYIHELAGLFHSFYTSCRVLNDDEELQKARLVLVDSVKIILKNVLNLIGVTAPEKM